MEFVIKELDKEQIKRANDNSMSGTRGDHTNYEYNIYCNEAISWKLSDAKTQKILDKIYKYYAKYISLCAQHVSVAVAGASGYNANKLDKSEQILKNSADFIEWYNDLRKQATTKPYDRTSWLIEDITMCVTGNISVTKQWRELAARSMSDFRILFEELNAKYPFSKSSLPYKIYHGALSVEPIKIKEICSNGDYKAWSEDDYTYITFRLKVARQMVVALKSRGFIWISSREAWRSSKEGLTEWVISIPEKYRDYI